MLRLYGGTGFKLWRGYRIDYVISIIVPILNEEKTIKVLLDNVAVFDKNHYDLIFADGGSTDKTLEIIGERFAVINCPRGRGAQCNFAARTAKGDILFFLHADSRVSADVLSRINRAVDKGAQWGCLKLRFDDPHILMFIGAFLSNLRVRRSGVVFGDQGILITKYLFDRLGGFHNLPLMEDYQFSLNLKRLGIPPIQIDSQVTTSARRFQTGSRLRTGLKMYRLRHMYRKGVSMEVIRNMYKDIRQ